ATYQDFIRRYPHNAMAVEAARKLEAIRTPSDNKSATQDEIVSDSVNKAARESLAETPAPSPFASRPAGSSAVRATLTSVQYTAKPESTRLAIELDGEARYQTGLVPQGNRLFFDV